MYKRISVSLSKVFLSLLLLSAFLFCLFPKLSVHAAESGFDTTVSGGDTIPPEINAVYYILRENLVQPSGDTFLAWNGYWRVGYGTITGEQEVFNNASEASALLGAIPTQSSRLQVGQQVEWFTVRKTSTEWRVEGRIISDAPRLLAISEQPVIDNAMFYLLNRDISRNDSDRCTSRSVYFTQIGYGTIDISCGSVNDSTTVADHIVYAPDCSSFLSEGEYVEWYAVRNKNGNWEVEGEICTMADNTPKAETATYYLLNRGLEKPDVSTRLPWDCYTRVGYGSIYTPKESTADSEEISNLLSEVPDCSSYLKEGEAIEWYAVRECSDSTAWRVDGMIISPESSKTKDFIRTNGSQIVDSDGNPFQIKGIGMGNNVWYSQWQLPTTDHDEESYAELEELGFNSIRFYLNASLFESDSTPYTYSEEAFQWLDQNVEWAEEHHIRLLLNMHIPQGGKTKASNTVFWDDAEYQNRFIALWKTIAERYADNDAVLGYGLLNEPFVIECSTPDESLDLYYDLMNKTAEAIRSVDNNHMLFVERPYGTVNSTTKSTNYIWGTTDSFRLINDSNTVYEFHFYDRTEFTHQGLDWLTYTDKWVYNTNDIALLSGSRKLGKICKTAPSSLDVASYEWQHVESEPITITNGQANYGYWLIYLYNMGENSNAYIDNIIVKEFDENGDYVRDVSSYDFNATTSCAGWDLGTKGGGKYTYNSSCGVDSSGCAQISNVTASYRFYRNYNSVNVNFQLDPAHTYIVCADVLLDNVTDDFSMELGIQTATCDKVYSFDKEYLRYRLQPFLEFGAANNVPLYLGEFGVTRHVMNEEYQGAAWVEDMFDLINEYGLGYSYHDYHEQNFGLYINDSRSPRDVRNETLYQIFSNKVS